jgi:ADP-ribose pyrophosphatase YjhB (NUDIX family)
LINPLETVNLIMEAEVDERQLRQRAVAVVLRKGKVLLVKDKTLQKYSLPGGGLHEGEILAQAASRELYEETRLKAIKCRYIGSFKGAVSHHKAFLIEAKGRVHLRNRHGEGGGELSAYAWWDMKSPLPVYQHVRVILGLLDKRRAEGRLKTVQPRLPGLRGSHPRSCPASARPLGSRPPRPLILWWRCHPIHRA